MDMKAALSGTGETQAGAGATQRVRVWDAPTRLFHWALVVLVATSFTCAKLGWMEQHFLSGYAILSCLLFRLVWGLVGSDTARFARFLASPAAALRHLRHLRRREPDTEIGHNAAGGWMVMLMLALLGVQAGTGLFANDDAISEGPLYRYVGKDLSDRITGWHNRNFKLILAAVAVHLLAILVYAVFKRQDLLRPMLTGRKDLPVGTTPPRMRSPALAAVLFALAVAVVLLVLGRP